MGDHPAVNTHVLFLLLAISILYLVFSFTLWIPLRVLVQGDTPLGLMTDGLFVLVFLGQVALFAVLIYAGLYLGRRLALGAPLLEGWFAGEPVRDRAVSALKVSVAAGLGVAAIKYLLDLVIFSPFLPATLSGGRDMHLLLRLAIPFQQGIGDEIIYRLFWMTMFVWILWKLRGSGEAPGAWAYRAGILLAGLISVAAPLLRGVSGLAAVQYAAIILAGAIPFGWLYWKKGIEAAILAHLVSSVVLVMLAAGLTG